MLRPSLACRFMRETSTKACTSSGSDCTKLSPPSGVWFRTGFRPLAHCSTASASGFATTCLSTSRRRRGVLPRRWLPCQTHRERSRWVLVVFVAVVRLLNSSNCAAHVFVVRMATCMRTSISDKRSNHTVQLCAQCCVCHTRTHPFALGLQPTAASSPKRLAYATSRPTCASSSLPPWLWPWPPASWLCPCPATAPSLPGA